jgi:hypothetical protein
MPIRILLALAATGLLAACGSDPNPSSANTEQKNRQAMLAYAKCMRQHGVPVEDPKFGGGRTTMRAGGKNVSRHTMDAAQQACEHFQKEIKAPPMSKERQAEFRKAALANAKCMREHGIDFPDPTFDANGGARVKIGRGTGVDPDSAKFKAADKACQKTLPKLDG